MPTKVGCRRQPGKHIFVGSISPDAVSEWMTYEGPVRDQATLLEIQLALAVFV
jgi:hypothetical protein